MTVCDAAENEGAMIASVASSRMLRAGNVHIKLSLLFLTPCCGLDDGVLAA
jgi:hypothetical protein